MVNFEALIGRFREEQGVKKWDVPFPMAVFGTLRQGWSNHHLMGSKLSQRIQTDARGVFYLQHYKAFLPHFTAVGLSLKYQEEATAPCEVFTYDPLNWRMMIPRVDGLEGFTPGTSFFYHRTLVWMHILPKTYKHDFFNVGAHRDRYREERCLGIPVLDWMKYPRMPCWIYSSAVENEKSQDAKKTPIIWDGVAVTANFGGGIK